ncbi:MAG TPA: NAD(P)/FAD-dependent oxidoreductase [Gaiellaceae bacterium]|nr:NAD(P)/FAD-dependent oxidoreductase [Gaiellaceae bacterium]
MARTPLLDALQRITADVATEERRTSRRDFLRDAAAAGAATTAFGVLASRARAATPPGRVVVVGAGLAGLTAAYRLKQAGVVAEVHEASDRIGGRCWTLRDFFAEGQIGEHGGELIDQGHTALRQLVSEFGLKLDNLLSAENGTEQTNWFDGARYSYAQATNDLKTGWQKLHKDVSAASYPTLFDLSTPRGRELDQMSIVDWINETFPGGIDSKIGQLLDVAYNIEYGAESSEQSSLNLIYLLGYRGAGNLRIFGASNEKYHVVGGNDQVPARLAQRLAGQITTGSELVAIRVTAAGRWELTFRQGSGTKTITADRVVLALPFSIMRASVNFSKAGWERLKEVAIREQGMGTNSKLHVQFSKRFWSPQGFSGETYSDRGYQSTWEVTRAQPGTSGILVDYTGGKIGASFGSGTAQSRAEQFLAQIEPVLPGATQAYNGKAFVDFWLSYPWAKGSYSYWKVGQYTKFAGMEGRRQGTCHFAGEHTSIDFQGYLNGAVETGERAADEILADLK